MSKPDDGLEAPSSPEITVLGRHQFPVTQTTALLHIRGGDFIAGSDDLASVPDWAKPDITAACRVIRKR